MIAIKTSDDVHQFLEIVQVFIDDKNRHKFELDTYLDRITELEKELDTERSVKEHLGEQNKEHRHEIAEATKIIDYLRTELLEITNKNVHLQNALDSCLSLESKLNGSKDSEAKPTDLKNRPF
jgi:chromosome segregation ATPase